MLVVVRLFAFATITLIRHFSGLKTAILTSCRRSCENIRRNVVDFVTDFMMTFPFDRLRLINELGRMERSILHMSCAALLGGVWCGLMNHSVKAPTTTATFTVPMAHCNINDFHRSFFLAT